MSQAALAAHLDELHAICGRLERVRVMEICGTHTVSFFRTGIKSMLPANLRLVSGPGCPVCVTSQGYIDAACEIASRPNVIVCTYGDMVRVPGRSGSLEHQRGRGANVTVVYSARDAVRIAAENPTRDVVFLAVGFETTAPATAVAILEARERGLTNFFVLSGHKLVIPAMSTLLSAGDVPIDGFLCPGHVSVIIGTHAYAPIAENYRKPCVVAGFEPDQMVSGLLCIARMLERGEARLDNVYRVAVSTSGNPQAREILDQVFEPADTVWRAMGVIPQSGLSVRPAFAGFDALKRFDITLGADYDPPGCRCGEVIQGKLEPADCPLFVKKCTPLHPIGPCMVSSEGTCAAWYKYGRHTGTRHATPTMSTVGVPSA